MIRKILATCMGAALAVLLVGCASGGNETKTEETPQAANDKAAEYTIVGEQANGNIEVLATNKTGQAISTLTLKQTDAQSFGDNLVKKSTTLAANEEFLLCFKPAGVDTTYEMAITLADGTQYTLTELRLTDYKSMDLLVKDGRAYASYTTLSGQNGTSPQVAKADGNTQSGATQSSATQSSATQSNAQKSTTNQSNSSQTKLPDDSMENWTQEQWDNSAFVDSEDYHGDAGPVDPQNPGYQGADTSE